MKRFLLLFSIFYANFSQDCIDTPDWTVGTIGDYDYSTTTCATYANVFVGEDGQEASLCNGKGFTPGWGWLGEFGNTDSRCENWYGEPDCAKLWNYPSQNCCVCGKGDVCTSVGKTRATTFQGKVVEGSVATTVEDTNDENRLLNGSKITLEFEVVVEYPFKFAINSDNISVQPTNTQYISFEVISKSLTLVNDSCPSDSCDSCVQSFKLVFETNLIPTFVYIHKNYIILLNSFNQEDDSIQQENQELDLTIEHESSILKFVSSESYECQDTPDWNMGVINGIDFTSHDCSFFSTEWQTETIQGSICEDGAFKKQWLWLGDSQTFDDKCLSFGNVDCAQLWNYPADNCCVCGKGKESVDQNTKGTESDVKE